MASLAQIQLAQIRNEVRQRTEETSAAHANWPCRRGCDDCCRSLASEPLVTEPEWREVAAAVRALPDGIAAAAFERMRETAGAPRPLTCPLLDRSSGECLVYEARPLACRTYGFYAERQFVLGCGRIEALAASPEVVWGNQAAVDAQQAELGPIWPFSRWLAQSILL